MAPAVAPAGVEVKEKEAAKEKKKDLKDLLGCSVLDVLEARRQQPQSAGSARSARHRSLPMRRGMIARAGPRCVRP